MSSKCHINQLFSRDFPRFSSRGEEFSARVFSRHAMRRTVKFSSFTVLRGSSIDFMAYDQSHSDVAEKGTGITNTAVRSSIYEATDRVLINHHTVLRIS